MSNFIRSMPFSLLNCITSTLGSPSWKFISADLIDLIDTNGRSDEEVVTIPRHCVHTVKGDSALDFVKISPELTVAHLKKLIHWEAFGDGGLPLSQELLLWKVRGPLDSYQQGWHGANRTYYPFR
jgi:hypothetical protein